MGKSYGTCTYCKRELQAPTSRARTAKTRDHVMPACAGGTRKVRCCRECNGLKGDLHPTVWRWFTENHPRWWKSFTTNQEVLAVCRLTWGAKCRPSINGRARRDREVLGGLAGSVL